MIVVRGAAAASCGCNTAFRRATLGYEVKHVAAESSLEQYRASREVGSSKRRTGLIDAAEALFLENGIADATMMNIAERAGVSRVTVYRYFSERDHVAYEVAGRMLSRLAAAARSTVDDEMSRVEAIRAGLLGLVVTFEEMRDVHRFLAMFDNLGPFRESSDELEHWYRARSIRAFAHDRDEMMAARLDEASLARLVTLTNTVLGVLARFAMRADEIERELGIDLTTQLGHIESMVGGYFDDVVAPHVRFGDVERPRQKQPT